ncbi:MAG: NfeD family protein [Bradymonadia bacterium]
MPSFLMPQSPEFWLIIAIALAILEVLDGSFFLLSLGLGCLAPSLAAYLGITSIPALVGICIAGQLAVFFSARPFFNKVTQREDTSTNVGALIGREAYVTSEVKGTSSPGYVKIGGEEWRAIGTNERTLTVGVKVFVESVSGSTVTVSLERKAKAGEG